MNKDKQQREAARKFAERWKGRGYEKGESQTFWIELLTQVYGVGVPSEFIRFEKQTHIDHTAFVDAIIPSTHVLIEQKSLGKDLRGAIKQSDGYYLTPFQQAQRYSASLPYSERPRWIVTCNFREFDVYDMERPNEPPEHIWLKDLPREYYRLNFLVAREADHVEAEVEVSIKAGELVGLLYDALIKRYGMSDPRSARYLNILCVRLVFCLYAEDAGVFGHHKMFHDYLDQFPSESMRGELLRLFEVLNTPESDRSPYLRADLAAFPYTNGGLFAEQIDIPQLTDDIRAKLLFRASQGFDWSEISPTIFGAVFESTLNPETRRAGGMHYTSIENIHRVIDPLFLDALTAELDEVLREPAVKKRLRRLHEFQDKLSSLVFFDPACGSGNFLTETYLSLRRLENRVIRVIYATEQLPAFVNPIKVSIHQFYGVEINDFAVTVATTALWISESQMMAETERVIHHELDFLPLRSYANIHEGNALRTDWGALFADGKRPDYIIGNPPFVGARLMGAAQKEDMVRVFGEKWKNVGNLDYVAAWYKLCADFLHDSPRTACALVSTNSVAQGEQVANLWSPLFADGLRIHFAHRTFRWDSEASQKAHVHVVIIGFARFDAKHKYLFDGSERKEVEHINAYLTDGPDVFISSRNRPLCTVPQVGIGNQPIDGGNYLFTREEMEAFVKREPKAAPLFHPWYGAVEFIHRQPRYCLWLGDCTPHELAQMPLCRERVERVRALRLKSKRGSTLKLADRPTRFQVENMPEGDSIIIPSTSSERRRYLPMGFIPKGTFASNAVHLVPNATLYHFGILESSVHMAWMRAVCGRLKSDYRYSKDVVYNNFPWPSVSEEHHAAIAEAAQGVLNARDLYPDSTLADLYDPTLMPSELREAHRHLDRLVLSAYGFPAQMDEAACVAALFERYEKLLS